MKTIRFLVLALMSLSVGHANAGQPFVFGRADFATGNAPAAMATADFNGDGNLDFAVVNQGDGTVSIYFGRQDGSFAKSADYAVGAGPDAIAVGDFNGDGKPDLAVTNQNCNNSCGPGSVAVLLNRGDGTFQAAISYVTGTDPVAVVIGDFDDDGEIDLAVANAITTVEPVPGTVSIFLNQGDGSFQHAGDYPAGTGVGHLTAITLAAGQASSLAVTNYVSLGGTNAISILRNHGDGTFQLPVSYNTGKGPS